MKRPWILKSSKPWIFVTDLSKSDHFWRPNNNECYCAINFWRKWTKFSFLSRFFNFLDDFPMDMRFLIKEFHEIFRRNRNFRFFKSEKCLQTPPLTGFSDPKTRFSVGRQDRFRGARGRQKGWFRCQNRDFRCRTRAGRKSALRSYIKTRAFGSDRARPEIKERYSECARRQNTRLGAKAVFGGAPTFLCGPEKVVPNPTLKHARRVQNDRHGTEIRHFCARDWNFDQKSALLAISFGVLHRVAWPKNPEISEKFKMAIFVVFEKGPGWIYFKNAIFVKIAKTAILAFSKNGFAGPPRGWAYKRGFFARSAKSLQCKTPMLFWRPIENHFSGPKIPVRGVWRHFSKSQKWPKSSKMAILVKKCR